MIHLVDTGPLVAYLNDQDRWNHWTLKQFGEYNPPFITCESVISEALFLLARDNIHPDSLLELIDRGDIVINSVFQEKQAQKRIRNIINTYLNIKSSLADACLVYMYENAPRKAKIFTLDSDFNVYRSENGEPISTISP